MNDVKTLNDAPPKPAEKPAGSLSKGQLIGGIAGIVAAVIVYLIPMALEPVAHITLALTLWLLLWLIFRPIDSGYTGLIFILCLVLLQFPTAGIFTWFTISPGWFQISAFVIAATMVKSGLAKRLAYTLMYRLGANTVPRFMAISVVVVFLMILLVPSPTALIAITIPLMIFVAEAWDLPARSEVKKGVPPLAMACFLLIILCGSAGSWVKTGMSLNLLTLTMAKVDIEWIDWFKLAAPLIWVFGFVTVFFLLLLFKPSKSIVAPKEVLKVKVDELGPMTSTEKIVLAIMVVVLILWITESKHHISTGWVAMGAVCVFAIPKLGVFKTFDEAISSISWPVMFFITALSAMATALNTSGASAVIANAINVLKPDSVVGYYISSSLIGTFVTAILGINMVQGVIIPFIVGWAQDLGIEASKGLLAVWLPTVLGGNLLPSLLPSVLFAWTFKYKGEKLFTFGDGFKVALVAYVAYYVVAAVSQATYWNLI
jgi:di/tricarboxylate transporter